MEQKQKTQKTITQASARTRDTMKPYDPYDVFLPMVWNNKRNIQFRAENKARMKPYNVFLPVFQKSETKHRAVTDSARQETDKRSGTQ